MNLHIYQTSSVAHLIFNDKCDNILNWFNSTILNRASFELLCSITQAKLFSIIKFTSLFLMSGSGYPKSILLFQSIILEINCNPLIVTNHFLNAWIRSQADQAYKGKG